MKPYSFANLRRNNCWSKLSIPHCVIFQGGQYEHKGHTEGNFVSIIEEKEEEKKIKIFESLKHLEISSNNAGHFRKAK